MKNALFSFKSIGKGFLEEVRYELAFGYNNYGHDFVNGHFVGTNGTLEDFHNEVAGEIVHTFDTEIRKVEKTANKIFSLQWVILQDEQPGFAISCLNENPASGSTCDVVGLGDYNIPFCKLCTIRSNIDAWYKKLTKIVGNHNDPRLPHEKVEWPYLGNRLNFIFKKLEEKHLARTVEWKKLAFIIRCFLTYCLGLKLTQKLLLKVDPVHYANLDLVEELMSRHRGDHLYYGANFENIIEKVNELTKALIGPERTDEEEIFDAMTRIEGVHCQRTELEDWRYVGEGEHDEYLALHYENQSKEIGTVYGRMLMGRKQILLDPLVSKFSESLLFETTEKDYDRLARLGLTIGHTYTIPSRRFRSNHREKLWEHIEDWPPCKRDEGERVHWSEVRLKPSVPFPVQMIDHADAATALMLGDEFISLVEIL